MEEVLKKVVEPKGHEVFNYGMYSAEDEHQLTYVQNGILADVYKRQDMGCAPLDWQIDLLKGADLEMCIRDSNQSDLFLHKTVTRRHIERNTGGSGGGGGGGHVSSGGVSHGGGGHSR